MSQVVDPKSTGAYARAHQVVTNPSNAKDVANNNNIFSSNSSVGSLLDIVDSANVLQLSSARETNEFNAREAQKNRDWQEQMSNTAHQREVQDLIKAGLNPILSVNSGASTPSGATASGVKANTESGVSAIASIIGASINAGTQMAIANLNAKTNLEIAHLNQDNQLSYQDVMKLIAGLNNASAYDIAKLNTDTSNKNTWISSLIGCLKAPAYAGASAGGMALYNFLTRSKSHFPGGKY